MIDINGFDNRVRPAHSGLRGDEGGGEQGGCQAGLEHNVIWFPPEDTLAAALRSPLRL